MTNVTPRGRRPQRQYLDSRQPAIVTPMLEDGSLDLPTFRKLIDWHIEEGTSALVVVGTSGESATLSVEEHVLMVKTAVEHAAGRIPVIAGSGGNSTTEAIELTEHGEESRRGCVAASRAVLQQADAGRPVPPFRENRRKPSICR